MIPSWCGSKLRKQIGIQSKFPKAQKNLNGDQVNRKPLRGILYDYIKA
jgi:hypothetical protein